MPKKKTPSPGVHPDARGKGISFYRKFGAKVFRTEFQTEERIPVDVFRSDMEGMKEKMDKSLEKYNV